LELRGITKDFNGFKIKDLTLVAEPRQYLVVIGPTGAGKTLLLETIQGFHSLDSGMILLDGVDITKLPHNQRRIAYVPQSPVFPPGITVSDTLRYAAKKVYGNAEPIIEGITELMHLSGHLDRMVVSLSGGEKRKLALARALIQQPKVLLLDEPLSNLDIMSRSVLRDEIKAIHRYLGLTTMHITHDQVEALILADKLAVVRDGVLGAVGTVEAVYSNPLDEYTARFFGYQNIYPVYDYQVEDQYTKVDIGSLTLRTTHVPRWSQMKVAIHGSEVLLHRRPPRGTGNNVFPGILKEIKAIGSTTQLTLDIGEDMVLSMGRRAVRAAKLAVGEEIWVQFSADAVKLIQG